VKVFFATDHAGYALKNELVRFVREELLLVVEDLGAHQLDKEDDYPDYIARAAKAVSEDPMNSRAIILGGSGQGEAIVANRYPGVRAVVYYGGSHDILTLSREHNDANVLSIGARFLSTDEARKAVKIWFSAAFSEDERHARRIRKIERGL